MDRTKTTWIIGLAVCGLLFIGAGLVAQDRPAYRGGPRGFRAVAGIQEGQIQPSSEREARIVAVLQRLDGQRAGMMNVPQRDGRILRILAESIGAKEVVEIGTSNGYSGLWICMALMSTSGRLTTFEIDPGRAAMARENFRQAGVDQIVKVVEGDAHQTVSQIDRPIDLVFIDADKPGYLDYLQKLLPLVRPGGLIVAHNVSPGTADPAFVNAITTNPALETVFLPQDTSGMSITLKKRQAQAQQGQ